MEAEEGAARGEGDACQAGGASGGRGCCAGRRRKEGQASGSAHDVSPSRVRAAGAAGRRGGRSLRLAGVWRPGHSNAVCAQGRGLGGDRGAASARAKQAGREEGEGASRLRPAGWARFASVMIWIALEGFGLHSSGALWRAPRVQRGFSGSGPGLWAALGRSGSLSRPSGFGTHHVALSGQRPTCHSVHPGRGDSSVRAQGVAAGGRVARLNNSRFFIKLRRSLQYGVAKHCNPTQATTAGAPPAPTR